MSSVNIQTGDWVRFYQRGILVIGLVNYIEEEDLLGKKTFCTDCGRVREENVLEIRSKSTSIAAS